MPWAQSVKVWYGMVWYGTLGHARPTYFFYFLLPVTHLKLLAHKKRYSPSYLKKISRW